MYGYLSLVEQNIWHVNPIEHHLGQFGSCQTCYRGENIQGTGHFMGNTYRKTAVNNAAVVPVFILGQKHQFEPKMNENNAKRGLLE